MCEYVLVCGGDMASIGMTSTCHVVADPASLVARVTTCRLCLTFAKMNSSFHFTTFPHSSFLYLMYYRSPFSLHHPLRYLGLIRIQNWLLATHLTITLTYHKIDFNIFLLCTRHITISFLPMLNAIR